MRSRFINLSNKFKKHRFISIILLLGLIVRLWLSDKAFHVDMYSIAGWSDWIYRNGPKGFYDNNVWFYSWPTQPPIVSLIYGLAHPLFNHIMWIFTNIASFIAYNHLAPTKFIWWFDFIIYFGTAIYKITGLNIGFLITIKLFGILADLVIAWLIYIILEDRKLKIIAPILFLFLPFSFYISALWGQYDQLSFLFIFLAVNALLKKWFVAVPLLVYIAIGIKPTALIFIPIFIWLYFRLKPKLYQVIASIIISLIFFIFTTSLVTDKNPFIFTFYDLKTIVFDKAESRVGGSAFNFWRIIVGGHAVNQNTSYFLLTASHWSLIFFILINLLVIFKTKVINLKSVIFGFFVVGFGSWLFLPGMLERYGFAGIVFGLLYCCIQKRDIKLWILLALNFSLCLFYSWKFPENLSFLVTLLSSYDSFVTRILPIINIAIFIWIIKRYKND